MAPTLKDSSALSSEPGAPASIANASQVTKTSQPVALEVPVTVNGARAVEGSDKREPFSENTTTVLVFANGAVIRLNSAVAPGQLLFLTNVKTRKEVVCQVVKSKNYGNNSGYVELEFTEPVSGFWGMRFPNERPAKAPLNATKTLDDRSSIEADARPTSSAAPTAEAPREFKTEIKADARPSSKADFLAPSEAGTVPPRLEANVLQEQLSALLSSEPANNESTSQPSPAKEEAIEVEAEAIETAEEGTPAAEATPVAREVTAPETPAPKSAPRASKSSFDDEEVKIPAWLQPLARNESVMAPPVVDETPVGAVLEKSLAHSEITQTPRRREAPSRPVSSATVFGNTLLSEGVPTHARSRSGSEKGIWIGAIAAAALAAAGSVWYFRDSFSFVQRNSIASQVSSPATPATVPPVSPSSSPNSAAVTSNSGSSPSVESTSPDTSSQTSRPSAISKLIDSPSPAPGKLQTAAISERIPKASSSSVDAAKQPASEEDHIIVVEPEKRPPLGTVHLAKPKVSRSKGEGVNAEMEPTLDGGDQPPVAGSSLSSDLVTGNTKEPAAPTAHIEVGGEVRTARLISSIPPVYPALARAQHISGDVRIDALIDATGHVTTMKVVSGPSLLHQAAMDALRQWKYQPAMLDGKAVAMHLTVTIQFRLK